MSLPRRANITIYKGATFGPFTINATRTTGEAIDLTGWTAFGEVRSYPEDPNSYDLAPTITDEAAGEITIQVSYEATDAYTAGRYDWDVMVENPDGERILIVKGTATIQGLATQP